MLSYCILGQISVFGQFFHPVCNSSGSTDCELFPACQEENTPYISCWDFDIGRDVCCYSPPPPGGETTYPEPDYDNECAYVACVGSGIPNPCAWLIQDNYIECDDNNACTGGNESLPENKDMCLNGKCVGGEINYNPETHCCHPHHGSYPLDQIGICVDENCIPYTNETPCGDGKNTRCTNPDMCINGICDPNDAPVGMFCNDFDDCTFNDGCYNGECEGMSTTSILQKSGPRRLKVTVNQHPFQPPNIPISLKVTSDHWPCIQKYVTEFGTLSDTPIFRSAGDWISDSPIFVYGKDIVPNSIWKIETNCQGSSYSTYSNSKMTTGWIDIAGPVDAKGNFTVPDGIVDFNDISAMVAAFKGEASAPPMETADVVPEIVDHIVDFNDIMAAVEAFQMPGNYPFSYPCE